MHLTFTTLLLTREHFTQTPLHTDYTLKTHLANLESDSKVITACCTRFYANIPDCTGNAWEVFVSEREHATAINIKKALTPQAGQGLEFLSPCKPQHFANSCKVHA